MKKFIYLFLLIFVINNLSYAGSPGDAQEYKITIYKIELCENGSSAILVKLFKSCYVI